MNPQTDERPNEERVRMLTFRAFAKKYDIPIGVLTYAWLGIQMSENLIFIFR